MNQRHYTPSEFYKKLSSDLDFDRRDAVILLCAILIASIGLNMNSIPTVIGAMLISPLMTPIMGMGVSLGLYSIPLFKKSLKLLLMEIAVSLAVSILYFWLSPISYASEQIIARTSPNIWDILIAFVGGIAGFIGAQQKESSNIVPGVAIATALMPPLCTVGYAIAQGNVGYFLGASYLFLINFVFIMLASLLGMYVTSFRRKMGEYRAGNRMHRGWFIAAIFIFSIPSVISAGSLVANSYGRLAVSRMVETEFANVTILSQTYDESSQTLSLVTYGEKLSDQELDQIRERLGSSYGLKKLSLKVQQVSSEEQELSPEIIRLLEESRTNNQPVEDQVIQKRHEETTTSSGETSSTNTDSTMNEPTNQSGATETKSSDSHSTAKQPSVQE